MPERGVLVEDSSSIQRGVGVQNGPLGGFEHIVEPSPHRHGEDHVALLAANVDIAEHIVGDAPDVAGNPIQVGPVGHGVMIAENAPEGSLVGETSLQALDASVLPPENALSMIARLEQARSREQREELVVSLVTGQPGTDGNAPSAICSHIRYPRGELLSGLAVEDRVGDGRHAFRLQPTLLDSLCHTQPDALPPSCAVAAARWP